MMSVLPVGFGSSGGVNTGDIGHSLRFRGAQWLSFTPASAGNRRTFQFGCGVKLATSASRQVLLSAYGGGAGHEFEFDSTTNQFLFQANDAGAAVSIKATPLYRDPTGHMFAELEVDTTQATAADRVKIKVNGVYCALTITTSPALNAELQINNNVLHNIGRRAVDSTFYLQGYLSRAVLVGGGVGASFSYLNTEINEWVSKSQSAVKAVVDAGGTNSTMLDFDDATSLTTLGYDKSSKGNNWTLNNFSLTAGTTYDHMLDVPGNSYPTMSPLDPSIAAAGVTLSNGNLTVVTGGAGYNGGHATVPFPTTGKWYCEVEITSYAAGADIGLDFADTTTGNIYPGYPATSYAYRYDGSKGNNASWVAYGTALADGNIVGLIYDADNGKLYFSRQGTVQNSGDPVAGTGFAYSGLSGSPRLWLGDLSGALSSTYQINFGQRPFAYTPPTGFLALCQANLPTPAILNPKLHFDIGLVTGNASVDQVISTQFAPDFLWAKARNAAIDHGLFDKIRGGTNYLSSNTTAAETNSAPNTVTFNSTGVSLKAGGSIINDATRTYADWLWKAGGAAVSNTAGSITSQVSANVDAGFSVVKHVNTGAPATIGHGLGKAPKLCIHRVYDRTENWRVYFGVANEYLILNTTNAKTTDANIWNNTQPTSSVFSIGTYFTSGDDIISYCFADIEGYSKAFSYTGNGSADGPYVHLGFKPRWILIKRTSGVGSWWIYDAIRNPSNAMNLTVRANAADAEITFVAADSTATSVKLRTTDADFNAASNTYIGFAIADVAGKYSLGR